MTGAPLGLDWGALLALAPSLGIDLALLAEYAGAIERGLLYGPPQDEMIKDA